MKTEAEILELIKRGENHNVEFKSKFEPEKVGNRPTIIIR